MLWIINSAYWGWFWRLLFSVLNSSIILFYNIHTSFLKVEHRKICLRREIVACLWRCPLSLQSILLFILEKGQLDALCLSCFCQAPRPWSTPPASASLPALPSSPPVTWLWAQVPGKETTFWGHPVACQPHKAFHHVIWLCWAISPTLSLVYFLDVFHFLNPYSLKTSPLSLHWASSYFTLSSQSKCLCLQELLPNPAPLLFSLLPAEYSSPLLNTWLPCWLEVLWG